MHSHTKHLFARNSSCPHAERISFKITLSCMDTPICGLATTGERLYTHKLPVVLNFLLMSLSHASGQHWVTGTKNVLSRARPARTHRSVGSGSRPQMRVPVNRASQPAPGRTVLALDKLRALHRKVREDNEKKHFLKKHHSQEDRHVTLCMHMW